MSILGLGSDGGGAFIRFLPSANAWMKGAEEVQVGQIILDVDSVRTGWGKMAEGQAPEWQWDERLGVRGPQPSPDHKRGFSIRLYTKALGVAEWSSTGTGPCMGFDRIFTAVWEQRASHPGQVPVIKYAGSEPIKVGKGNTRVPKFDLQKWVDRPSELDGGAESAPVQPAPTPQRASPPAASDEDEY